MKLPPSLSTRTFRGIKLNIASNWLDLTRRQPLFLSLSPAESK